MPSGSLFDAEDRAGIIARLRRLRPDSRPAWGNLTAPRLLCHLADQMRVGVGAIPSRPVGNLLHRTLLKTAVIYTGVMPPRGKVATAPEMLSSTPTSWEADLAACVTLAEQVGAGAAHTVHPTFGPLTPAEWGRLCWKHLHHHLLQFGV